MTAEPLGHHAEHDHFAQGSNEQASPLGRLAARVMGPCDEFPDGLRGPQRPAVVPTHRELEGAVARFPRAGSRCLLSTIVSGL